MGKLVDAFVYRLVQRDAQESAKKKRGRVSTAEKATLANPRTVPGLLLKCLSEGRKRR